MTASGSKAWWEAVEPVTVEVTCGTDRHRLSWRRGKLVLEDHDLAAEESFAALGGEPALCLEVLRAWRAGVDDHRVLWFWDTQRAVDPDLAAMVAGMRSRQQQQLAQQRVPVRHVLAQQGRTPAPPGGPVPQAILDRMKAEMASEHRRSLLSALPEELRLRLGLSAIVRAGRRRGDRVWFGTRAPDLEAALVGRARPAFEDCMRAWRGRLAHRRLLVECWIAGPAEDAAVCGLVDDTAGWAAVRLPLLWLVEVWARGVALVDGCFVLGVHSADAAGTRLDVTAARWERRLPAGLTPVIEPAIVVRGEAGWRLRWAN